MAFFKKRKKRGKRLEEILNNEEKKRFIQTLLIVAGLLTIFNRADINIIPLFTLFVVGSLMYIIWLSILEKTDKKRIVQNRNYSMIYNSFLSAFIAFSFSGIVAFIGLQGISIVGIIGLVGIVLLLSLYVVLGAVLYYVLYKNKKL